MTPYSPFGVVTWLGGTADDVLVIFAVMLAIYLLLTQVMKTWLHKSFGVG